MFLTIIQLKPECVSVGSGGKEKRGPLEPGITQQGLYTRNGWLIRANHYTLRADYA